MRSSRTTSFARALMGLVALGAVVAAVPARAIPAYTNRTGIKCSGCHTPVYARLNEAGWMFRRLGYRTPAEIGQNMVIGQKTDQTPENTKPYSIADTISIMARMRYDDIARQRAQRFSQFYVSDVIGFFSGPMYRNWGYFLEPEFMSHAPTFDSTNHRFFLPSSEFETEFATVKFFTGSQKAFFSAKAGQFGFGGIDGFMGNDRPISTGRPMMFTTMVNEFAQDTTQRGLDVGYTWGANHVGAIALNGVNEAGEGDKGRPINSPDWLLQGIHWFDRVGSSGQVLYYKGKTPLDANANFIDSFDRVFVLGNWRRPVHQGHAVDLLAGYMHGTQKKATITNGAVSGIGGDFSVNSYFVEGDYEVGNRFVPYLRWDALHSNETSLGTALTGNPARNTRLVTLGVAYQPEPAIRLNLEYQARRPNPGSNQDMVRAQLWLMW